MLRAAKGEGIRQPGADPFANPYDYALAAYSNKYKTHSSYSSSPASYANYEKTSYSSPSTGYSDSFHYQYHYP